MSEIGPATRRDLEKRLRPGRSGRIPTVRLNLDVTVAPELTRQLEEHARKLIREANDEREAAIRAEMERLGLTEEEVVRDRSWAAQWDVSTGAFRGLVRLPDVPESEEDDAVDGLRYAVDFISKAQRALFLLLPGLNDDDDELGVPREGVEMRSALSEATGYIESVIAQLERKDHG